MADVLLSLESETRPLMTVFDDFLTMLVDGTTFGIDLNAGADRILARYNTDECRRFKAALGLFQKDFEERHEANLCPDILGEFYETHLYGKGASQRFLPWEVCRQVAKDIEYGSPNRHVEHAAADPCCGSGRLLLAHLERFGIDRLLLGIDPDPLCAKMAALNLFLKGAFIGEVMCADVTKGGDHFVFSYRLSLVPYGLIRITERTDSMLWHFNHEVLSKHRLASDLDHGARINVIRVK